ncbi:MAG: HU family DNA-binding protein [Candidatus Latescibacteria bacterium]|jgi:DNA-binding protein HU-beta|nr:HU family DNA-binding protein [Candidatus Latescibacterota bacterium]
MPNKAELVDAISEKADISKKDAEAALNAALGEITGALKTGERVTISGFGTFSVGSRAARTGRNPQTGATIQIPASKTIRFKAGKALKDAVQ